MSVTDKALFVIERNLDRDLSLAEIAKACDVSRFHLSHAFGETTGLSVMEYLRGRRLTKAAYALASGAPNILSVALDAGYQSHEAFSRAIKTQFGMTPDEVRKSESLAGLKLVDAIHHRESKDMKLKVPRFEKAGELLFVGLKERVPYNALQSIAGHWHRFMSGPYSEIENRIAEPPFGISMASFDDGIDYICASGVTKFGSVPEGCATLRVDPAIYAVFAHDDHITRLHETYEAIWNDWFPSSGKAPSEAPALERHNDTFNPRTGNGGVTIWIPLKP